MTWTLSRDLLEIRNEFPILKKCIYLISNSLGAVPSGTRAQLEKFYKMWSELGVSAWEEEWWDLARNMGAELAAFLKAQKQSVTMMTSSSQAHWVALSTQFNDRGGKRNKIVMTEHDFPSTLYAVKKIADFMNWEVELVKHRGREGIEAGEIARHIDERTLFVAVSHVLFKSAFVLDIKSIAEKARENGAITLIDGYHGPGAIPIDLTGSGVDFYIGGCLKWLCGGPGNAFLYSNPQSVQRYEPMLTGWFAHQTPFAFDLTMKYTEDSYRFMSGTHPIPCLYAALSGLSIIKKVGIRQIRRKSLKMTDLLIRKARDRDFHVFTPMEHDKRGGAVSMGIPHAFQVKQALDAERIKVDFRKGGLGEPDVIRIGPHFYNETSEIDVLFEKIDETFAMKKYLDFPSTFRKAT